jgi:transposase
MFVDVAGMANDDTRAPADLVGSSYEARKGPVRGGGGSGVEVRVRAVRRRSWSPEEKLRIVRETLEPGAVAVAERHGIGTGLLFTRRREMLAAAMSGFAPVEVVAETPRIEAPAPAPTPAKETAPEVPGTVEVAFPSGATVRVSGRVEPELLRGVLAELGGR